MASHGIGHVSALGLIGHKTPEQIAKAVNAIQRYLVTETRLKMPAIFYNEAMSALASPSSYRVPRAFGAPGAGGSLGFADPDARLGYAYVMNKLDFYLENDPREKALCDAVYRAIARVHSERRP